MHKIANNTSDRIDVLDGWRTVSVALVILGHYLIDSGARLTDTSSFAARQIYLPLLGGLANLGVSIFFVISGFVICRGFLKEVNETSRISLPAFYVRRFFRIVPALVVYVAVIITLAFLDVVQTDGIGYVARALTFTCNFPDARCGGWLAGHTWSLSVEEQFYLVIPFLFAVFASHRRFAMTALALVLPACVVGLAAFRLEPAGAFLVPFMMVGAGVAWALNEKQALRLVGGLPGWAVYPTVVMLPFLARACATRFWPGASVALAAVIVTLLAQTIARPSRLKTLLSLPAMRETGRASYGIYLWQQFALYPFAGAGALFYALSLTACVAWCFASFRWFETPLIRLGARLSRKIKSGKHPLTAVGSL